MSRIDVPGGWIQLRDPKSVKEKVRRPIMAKAAVLRAAGDEIDVVGAYELNDLISIAVIESWSFPYPVNVESMTELDTPAYDAIQRITAPLLSQMMPSFEVTPDPDSPTVPSGE